MKYSLKELTSKARFQDLSTHNMDKLWMHDYLFIWTAKEIIENVSLATQHNQMILFQLISDWTVLGLDERYELYNANKVEGDWHKTALGMAEQHAKNVGKRAEAFASSSYANSVRVVGYSTNVKGIMKDPTLFGLIFEPDIGGLKAYRYSDNSNLKYVILTGPSGTIYKDAFSGSNKIELVMLPSSTKIEDGAFSCSPKIIRMGDTAIPEDYEELKKSNASLLEEIAKMSSNTSDANVEALQAERDSLIAENAKLAEELAAHANASDNSEEVSKLLSDIDELKSERDAFSEKNSKLEEEVKETTEGREALRKQVDQLMERNKKLLDEIKELSSKDNSADLEADKVFLDMQVMKLTAEKEALQSAYDELSKDNVSRAEHDAMRATMVPKATLEALKATFDQRCAELPNPEYVAEVEAKLAAFEAISSTAEGMQKKLDRVNELTSKVRELEKARATEQYERSELTATHEALKTEVEELKAAKEQALSETEEVKASYAILEHDRNNWKIMSETFENQVMHLEKELTKFQKSISTEEEKLYADWIELVGIEQVNAYFYVIPAAEFAKFAEEQNNAAKWYKSRGERILKKPGTTPYCALADLRSAPLYMYPLLSNFTTGESCALICKRIIEDGQYENEIFRPLYEKMQKLFYKHGVSKLDDGETVHERLAKEEDSSMIEGEVGYVRAMSTLTTLLEEGRLGTHNIEALEALIAKTKSKNTYKDQILEIMARHGYTASEYTTIYGECLHSLPFTLVKYSTNKDELVCSELEKYLAGGRVAPTEYETTIEDVERAVRERFHLEDDADVSGHMKTLEDVTRFLSNEEELSLSWPDRLMRHISQI